MHSASFTIKNAHYMIHLSTIWHTTKLEAQNLTCGMLDRGVKALDDDYPNEIVW